jgi:hypothetical protein
MTLTRVSLYRHELEVIAKLTVELTRLTQEAPATAGSVEILGPEIFHRLANALYKIPLSRVYYGAGAPVSAEFGELP